MIHFSPLFFPLSLMDREVTLLTEMDKVKSETCKCFQIRPAFLSWDFVSDNMITLLEESDLNRSQRGRKRDC